MPGKLNVCFLWHMHQPYYREPESGKYILPWVRLHGIKGYTDMLAAIRQFGQARVTFNFTPCLLKQLEDLTEGNCTDTYYDLSLKSPDDLEMVEKKILLRHFFSANWETMVLCYPRYRDLLYRRGRQISEAALDGALKRFSVQDFLDLQVWFNLTWFGWSCEEKFELIPQLKRKGRDFLADEKVALLQLQQKVIGRIIPEYKTAWEEGLIEISTSPFYHPILPLLVDNYCARISQPQDSLPKREFRRPQDAVNQLKKGLEYAERILGRRPVGLWPSEGSVSPTVCELAHQVGFQWLATDESVLLGTLSNSPREKVIYQGHQTFPGGPTAIFRDRFLSDAIGFRYARNTPRRSVDDLMGNLQNIAEAQAAPEEHVAAIILDGENAWEYFLDGGRSFFEQLYERLALAPKLITKTVGDYIQEHPAKTVLPPIFPASWIGGSFRIWIGDPLKNLAWDRLKLSADLVDEYAGTKVTKITAERIREFLMIAEGSDWFWWYGEPNHSDFDLEFDQLFRLNQIQIYKELGLPVPNELWRPIRAAQTELADMPLFPMCPVIDGRETTFYEWVGARSHRASDYSGSMYLSTAFLTGIFYGISPTHLFLRLDPSDQFHSLEKARISIRFLGEGQSMLEISNLSQRSKPQAVWRQGDLAQNVAKAAYDKILEIAIPFNLLPRIENELHFTIIIMDHNLEVERWPRIGSYPCPWPTSDYLTQNWVI